MNRNIYKKRLLSKKTIEIVFLLCFGFLFISGNTIIKQESSFFQRLLLQMEINIEKILLDTKIISYHQLAQQEFNYLEFSPFKRMLRQLKTAETTAPCTDPNLYALNCDFDRDGILNSIDIDDDNDGIVDEEEYNCTKVTFENGLVSGAANARVITGVFRNGIDSALYRFTSDANNQNFYANFTNGFHYSTYDDAFPFDINETHSLDINEESFVEGLIEWGPQLPANSSTWSNKLVNDHLLTLNWSPEISAIIIDPNNQTSLNHKTIISSGISFRQYTGTINSRTWKIKFSTRGLSKDFNLSIKHENNIVIAYHGYGFKMQGLCFTADTDNDGIPNHLDLDSDADGCSDAYEAGAINSKLDSLVIPTGNTDVGSNGLADLIELNIDSGYINYISTYDKYAKTDLLSVCADTDMDGISDLIDIDDDNDGIKDSRESPGCFYTINDFAYFEGDRREKLEVNSGLIFQNGTPTLLVDGLFGSQNRFQNGQAITNKIIIEITPAIAVEIDELIITINSTSQTFFNDGCEIIIQGFTGLSWIDLSNTLSYGTTSGTATSISGAHGQVSFPITINNAKYKKYRILGQTGTIRNSYYLQDIHLNIINFIPEHFPKSSCNTDADGDGIYNHLDLDSDNDGCFDLAESGSGRVGNSLVSHSPEYTGVGNNGLADHLETTADSYTINYQYHPYAYIPSLTACSDNDNDGINDLIDIDDDNDGIRDVDECGGFPFLTNPDSICTLDTDLDGIPNYLDLDSDGDGCPDANEAGHGQVVNSDSTIIGFFGNNGLAASIENNDTDTATINYSILQTNLGKFDFLDATINGCLNNLPPTLSPIPLTVIQDRTGIICMPISDPNIGDRYTATSCGASNGSPTLTVNGNQLCLRYTPDARFVGQDSACVIICDQNSFCDTAYILITVLPGNLTPEIIYAPDTIFQEFDTSIVIDVSAYDNKNMEEDSTLQYQLEGIDKAMFIFNSINGEIRFSSPPDFENPLDNGLDNEYNIKVIVCDMGIPIRCDTQSISINVANDFAEDNIRLLCVDPINDQIIIKNFGTKTTDISPLRLCSKFTCTNRGIAADMNLVLGSLILNPNDSVILDGFPIGNITADLAIYTPGGSFQDSKNMLDFTQWGSAGNAQENVAVSKGIWSAGDYMMDGSEYCYFGNGVSENGVSFWDGNDAPLAIIDQVFTAQNISIVFDVQNNDITPDNDSLITTIIGSSTKGVHPIVLNGDSVNYIPPLDFIGVDSIFYQICDANIPNLCDTAIILITVSPDTDMDGISNVKDLDDDNDGIPDLDECPFEIVNFILNRAISDSTSLVYEAMINGNLETAIITASTNPQSLLDKDNLASPNGVILSSSTANTVAMKDDIPTEAALTISFSIPIQSIRISALSDMDRETGDAPTDAFGFTIDGFWTIIAGNFAAYNASTGILVTNNLDTTAISTLSATDDSAHEMIQKGVLSPILTRGNIGETNNGEVIFTGYLPFTSVDLIIEDLSLSGLREFIDNASFTSSFTIGIPLCDVDGDNVPNYLDLDSDADGCSDASEAGHGQVVQADSTITGPYGNNGMATSVENSDNNTTRINYTLRETNLGTPDYLDVNIHNCSNNLPPIITYASDTTFQELDTAVIIDVVSVDDNSMETDSSLKYELIGIDQALLNIDSITGIITFINAPDFEIPLDDGRNNGYNIEIIVCDNASPSLCDTQAVIITVTNDFIDDGIRLLCVDPISDQIIIKNFGNNTRNISTLRLCSKFSYTNNGIAMDMNLISGSLSLASGDSVILNGFILDDNAADLAIYSPTGSFTDPNNMLDFTQWGSADNGRESVADSKGIWLAGDFMMDAPEYCYFGNGISENGVSFWDGKNPPLAIIDRVYTIKNVGIIINVQNNDLAPDNDSLITTIIGSSTQGINSIVVNGDSVRYIPPTDFIGIDTITYQICDSKNSNLCDTTIILITVSPDTDNDGIPDVRDLDDDNDGIPDLAECPFVEVEFLLNSSISNSTALVYEAMLNGNLETVIITASTNPQSLLNRNNLVDQSGINLSNSATNSIEMKDDSLTESALTFTPSIPVQSIRLENLSDIDRQTGDAPTDAFGFTVKGFWTIVKGNLATYDVSTGLLITNNLDSTATTSLNLTDDSSHEMLQKGVISPILTRGNLGETNDGEVIFTAFTPFKSIDLIIEDLSLNGLREFISTTSNVASLSIGVPLCDVDGDNLPNHLDLDSDGDGCMDAIEAGHNQFVQGDSTIAGPYGNNGLANSVETNSDSDTLNYKILKDTTNTYELLDSTIKSTCTQTTTLVLKVMLQGAMIGSSDGLMRDDLRSQNFIPLEQPYTNNFNTTNRFTHFGDGGGETTTNVILSSNIGTSDAIVDWVFIELRDPVDSTIVFKTISALVQRDGDIVDASTGEPLILINPPLSFFVSIMHRNHLGAMKASPIMTVNDTAKIDFTTLALGDFYTKSGYNNLAVTTKNGKHALWAGDANKDSKSKYDGSANDRIVIGNDVITDVLNILPTLNYANTLGYFQGDINMDGKTKYDGANNDRIMLQNIILTYPLNFNNLIISNYNNMLEQLP